MMPQDFLKKYGSFLELAKMGCAPRKRKPSRVGVACGEDLEMTGSTWVRKMAIGGLVPDFIHRRRKGIVEVLECYYHTCQYIISMPL